MGIPGSTRQRNYRSTHPQVNVTFQDCHEHSAVTRACWLTGYTPREILVNWAEQFLAELQSEAGKPNDNSSCDPATRPT